MKDSTKLMDLYQLLPHGWQAEPMVNGWKLVGPTSKQAELFANGARSSLQAIADRLGFNLLIYSDCGSQVRRFRASRQPEPTPPSPTQSLSSYAPSTIDSGADFETILDFIKGKKLEGLIVTITGMGTDKCLIVNDLQAVDRGGGWTAQDWIGIDFKQLWRDSFQLSRPNFYGDLVSRVERDRHLTEFYYHIRRPSGALAEYSSNYFYVANFQGRPARIAVSKPGNWRIIEDNHLE